MKEYQIEFIRLVSEGYAYDCYRLGHRCVQLIEQKWVCVYPEAKWDYASNMLTVRQKIINGDIDDILGLER